jgi:hypothetical protein
VATMGCSTSAERVDVMGKEKDHQISGITKGKTKPLRNSVVPHTVILASRSRGTGNDREAPGIAPCSPWVFRWLMGSQSARWRLVDGTI